MGQSLSIKASGVYLFKMKNIAHLVNIKGSKFFFIDEKWRQQSGGYQADAKVSTSLLHDQIYIKSTQQMQLSQDPTYCIKERPVLIPSRRISFC